MYTPPIRSGEHNVPLDWSPPSAAAIGPHSSAHSPNAFPLSAPALSAAAAAAAAAASSTSSLSPSALASLSASSSLSPSASTAAGGAMQLMTFNSLLMFDIVFVFFLFLVGVTCLVYYLPPGQVRRRYHHHHHDEQHDQHSDAGGSMGAHCAVHQHQHHHRIDGPAHSSSYHELCSAHRALQREHGFAATVVLTATPRHQPPGGDADEAAGYSSGEDSESRADDNANRYNGSGSTGADETADAAAMRRRASEPNEDAASATIEFFTAVPPPKSFCTSIDMPDGERSDAPSTAAAAAVPPPSPVPLSPTASFCGRHSDYCGYQHSRPAPPPASHCHQHQYRHRPQPQCCYVTAKGIATGRNADPVQHV